MLQMYIILAVVCGFSAACIAMIMLALVAYGIGVLLS